MATYIVREGDTLSEIAQKYGTTYQAIAQANGISNPNLIYAGQTLNIGGSSASSNTSSKTQSDTTTQSGTTTTTPDAAKPETPAEPTAPKYTPSDTVTQAEALLNQQLSQKPGDYQSQWQAQINEILQQITNREKFSYNLNEDAMYQQYADLYTQQGKMAMMDTMGQAQAMTGGYGNSWAQSAGQQAYQAYLQKLNEVVPELHGMALDQYNQEGQNLLNQFAILGDQEDKDYGRYMDNMNAWLTERDYLAGRYDTERDYDYGKWADNRDYEYQVGRDKLTDEQWQKEFDEAKRQFDQQYALKTGSSGGGGGSSGGGSSSKGSSSSSYDSETAKIQQMLRNAGYNISVDGIWGPETQKAYDSYYGKGDDTEERMQSYVKRMLDNATSSQFNPRQVINGNSSLTSKEKAVALQILDAYISSGYMKF